MTVLLKMLPLMAALAGAPALAAEPDPHAGHHPPAAAAADATAKKDAATPDQAQGCPMMAGRMTGAQAGAAGAAPGAAGPVHGPAGKAGMAGMAQGKMMQHDGMHCMHAPPAAASEAAPGHDHPKK